MREIKFRAFVKDNKKLFPVYSLEFSNLESMPVEVATCRDVNCRTCTDFYELEQVEIMQYTGLKDKNGVEIYEGDIVKCTRGCPHEIIWLEEYGGTYIGGMPAWYLSSLSEGYAWTGDEEIIGNIYENPELMEAEK